MKNIFCFLENEFLQDITNIENLIYNMIPLRELENPVCTLDDFKTKCKNLIKENTSIEDTADLTIDLCYNYLFPRIPKLSKEDTMIAPAFNTGELYPPLKNFNNIIFQEYKNCYKNDLKNLMVLSYFYTQNKASGYIAKENNDLIDFFINEVSSKKDSTNESDLKPIVNKFYYFSRENNKQPILPFFFETTNGSERQSTKFISDLDIEILLGLIHSPNKKKNPFITGANIDEPLNIYSLLKHLKFITISSQSTHSILHYKHNENLSVSLLAVYNNFFLERITNLNFINALYSFKVNAPIEYQYFPFELINFAASPLINTRLIILKAIKEILNNHSYSMQEYNYFSTYLKTIFLHQILCVIPITQLVFYYLMSLKTNNQFANKDLLEDLQKYFFNEKDQELYYFKLEKIKKSGNENLVPSRVSIPFKADKNKEYMKLARQIYRQFILKSDYYSSQNFLSIVRQIQERELPNFLIQEFSSVNIPYDDKNPHNLIYPSNKASSIKVKISARE